MSSLAEEPLAPPQISTMETPLTPVREYLKEDKGRVEHHLIPVFDSSANGAAASDSPEVKKKDNSFFDATSQRWVLVNDFAFPEDENHFEKIERMQATQDLNPSLSSDTSSALLLDSETLNNNINAFQIQPGDDEMEFEKLFNLEIVEEDFSRPPNTQHQPKIVSPKEEQQQPSQVLSRPLRKLSDELGSLCLPSRSNPNTPRECQEDARLPGDESEPTSNAELTCLSKSSPSPPLFLKQGRKSAIPRYVRNTGSLSNSSQRSKSFSPSPVEKRVRQQRAPLSEDKMNPLTTRNLNRQKSRSAANLAAAESNIGLLSNRSNSKSEGNLPSLKVSASTASSKKANYSHVKSKVREYIAKVKNLPSKRHPPQNDDRESLVQQQQQSFLLSPGRKALSMSNLVSENKDASNSTSECKSVTNLTKMKAFLSSNHLDDFQITLSNSCGGGLNRSSRVCIQKSCVCFEMIVVHVYLTAFFLFLFSPQNSLSTFDRTRICRLLDNLSDSDEALVDDHPAAAEGCEDVSFDVEDVLILAMEERKEKKEAEKVLSQLQSNYDVLQRKYAEAENKIDKLR